MSKRAFGRGGFVTFRLWLSYLMASARGRFHAKSHISQKADLKVLFNVQSVSVCAITHAHRRPQTHAGAPCPSRTARTVITTDGADILDPGTRVW